MLGWGSKPRKDSTDTALFSCSLLEWRCTTADLEGPHIGVQPVPGALYVSAVCNQGPVWEYRLYPRPHMEVPPWPFHMKKELPSPLYIRCGLGHSPWQREFLSPSYICAGPGPSSWQREKSSPLYLRCGPSPSPWRGRSYLVLPILHGSERCCHLVYQTWS